VLALAGVVLLVPALQARLALAVAPIGGRISEAAGPTPFGLTAAGGSLPQAGLTMLVFALGAGLPMLALAYGSREALMRQRDGLRGVSRHAKPALGALLLVVAAMMLTGLDRRLETALVEAMPDWLIALTTAL
jgi:hypothetical protein